MPARNVARTAARTAARTPFCKICFDAGKPKSQYSTHFVKDSPGPNGKVVCPYLLSLACRYCHESGHTVKHCPKLEEKNSHAVCRPTRAAPPAPVTPAPMRTASRAPPAPKKPARATGFSVLANLPADMDPNADRPVEAGPRRVLFKAQGAWATGAPVVREPVPVMTPSQLAVAPLPNIADMDDSWMEGGADGEWDSALNMGCVADAATQ